MWLISRSGLLNIAQRQRPSGFKTAAVALAVSVIVGSVFGFATPVQAKGYDWYRTSDNWKSSRDKGGWDAMVLIGYSHKGKDRWINAEFSAYGEHFWAHNATPRRAEVTLSVPDPAEYKDWVDVTLNPGECITWGWESSPPDSLSDCRNIGDRNIREDERVVINVCGLDDFGWTCYGEAGES